MIQAQVIYDPVRDLSTATVLPTGATLDERDPRELAELLFAASVRHGHVSMRTGGRAILLRPAATRSH